MNDRQRQQRQHEEYWGRCWTVPLGRYLCAKVQSSRPDNDAHDIEFRIQRSDGTVTTSWGEVTGAYYDNSEAEWLWGPERPGAARGYIEPDARTGMEARDMAARKLGKYRDLADLRGRGHLLVLLHSPSCLSMKLSKAAETQRMSHRGFQSLCHIRVRTVQLPPTSL